MSEPSHAGSGKIPYRSIATSMRQQLLSFRGSGNQTHCFNCVTDGKNDDNSVIAISNNTMKTLGFSRGDVVLVKGKLRRDTVLVVLADTDLDDQSARLNRVVRYNLGVKQGDNITVHRIPEIKNARRVALRPFADTIEGLTGSLFGAFIAPYFVDAYRPVRAGDLFTVHSGVRLVEFKIVEVEPPTYGIVASDTVIYCEGEPIERVEEEKNRQQITFDDVGGYREQISQLLETVMLPQRFPFLFKAAGTKPPSGVLLCGSPGTGKSLIARAIASECNSFCFWIDSREIMAIGAESATSNLQKAFDEAEKNSPSIIFIDNIDSIAPIRERMNGEGQLRIFSQLMALIDKLNAQSQVMILAATNVPNYIDPSLRRFGRFDYEINIGVPNLAERYEILKIHTKNMKLADDVDLKKIAAETQGYVGSDIAALCSIAAMQQIRSKMDRIDLDEDTIDAEVLDSLTVTMENMNFGLKAVNEPTSRV